MTIKNLQAKLANRTGSAMDAPSNLVQGQVLSSENARIN
jgi:hypothetical protein